ncbi:WS/DGAT domain-containing protein [Streptomyces sp. SP18CS02]|uniref:WS/DGAT domain-containing protein n=1 Tax=Streptomyces sp. SP18CS02 TaxID=3002531 RepID=UPI002E7A2E05|nr:WS/DGAT domain-containing protein [Streptomyces sp. SP18CS02]MEE1754764.1 WS/DGAT domain-containing protein [Streptomyces sp. SP18CS02]
MALRHEPPPRSLPADGRDAAAPASSRRHSARPLEWARLGHEAAHHRSPAVVGGVVRCAGRPLEPQELFRLARLAVAAHPGLGRARAGSPFVPERHVFDAPVPCGTGQAGLRLALEELTARPLSGPEWGVWLVHGYEPQEFAVVLRADQNRLDGMLLTEIFRDVLARAPRSSAAGPVGVPACAEVPGAGRARGGAALATAVREGLDILRGLWPAARLLPGHLPLTGKVHYTWGSVKAARLHEIAAAYSATVDDVYLAALAGALGAWADGRGRSPVGPALPRARALPRGRTLPYGRVLPCGRGFLRGRTLRLTVPTGLRRGDEAARPGSAVVGAGVRLPVAMIDPIERIARVKTQTDAVRSAAPRPREGALSRVLPGRLGGWLHAWDLHPRRTTVLASHVPGTDEPLSLGDRTVIDMMPLLSLPAGQALAACLTEYAGTARICFVTDRAVTGHDELVRLWVGELDLLAARAAP